MLYGMLQWPDLTVDEQQFVLVLARVGRVESTRSHVIRGDLIAQIAMGSGPIGKAFADRRRFHIAGVVIDGKVDIADASLTCELLFIDCLFIDENESFDLGRSSGAGFRFDACAFAGSFRAENSRISGNVLFRDCIHSGQVSFDLAKVEGSFVVAGCLFEASDDSSLRLDGISVQGRLQIGDSYFSGPLLMREANIAAQTNLHDISTGFRTENQDGLVDLSRSSIQSELTLGPNLLVDRLAFVDGRARALMVDRLNARGDGGATITMDASQVEVFAAIVDSDSLRQVTMTGASLGQLKMQGVQVVATQGSGARSDSGIPIAVAADGIRINGDLTIGPHVDARGEFRFIGATIGGQVQIPEAQENPMLVNLEEATVASSVALDDVSSESMFHLAAARLGGILVDPSNLPRVSLVRTQYGYINDRDGATITGDVGVHLLERRLMPPNIAPYRFMAMWLQAQGDDRGSVRVSVAGEQFMRGLRGRHARVISWFLRLTVGYGYRPLLALWWFAALVVVGASIAGAMYGGALDVSSAAPPFGTEDSSALFNPLAYALWAVTPGGAAWNPWVPTNLFSQAVTLILQVLGWLLVTAVAAGVAVRIRR